MTSTPLPLGTIAKTREASDEAASIEGRRDAARALLTTCRGMETAVDALLPAKAGVMEWPKMSRERATAVTSTARDLRDAVGSLARLESVIEGHQDTRPASAALFALTAWTLTPLPRHLARWADGGIPDPLAPFDLELALYDLRILLPVLESWVEVWQQGAVPPSPIAVPWRRRKPSVKITDDQLADQDAIDWDGDSA